MGARSTVPDVTHKLRASTHAPTIFIWRAPMAQRKLKTVFQTQGHTQALKNGSVKPRTFDFEFEDVPVIIQAFRRMVRGLEFDISEMAITTYLCARANGKR